MDGEGCFKTSYGPWVSTKRLIHLLSRYEYIAMIALGRHGSLQRTLSQALNSTGLYNDYTFRSML